MVKDPVCGMNVNVQNTKYSTKYNNIQYHFCCEKCLDEFSIDPEFYLNGGSDENDCANCSTGGCSSQKGCSNIQQ